MMPHQKKRKPTPAAVQAMETAGNTIDEIVRQKFERFMQLADSGEKQFLAQVLEDRASEFGFPPDSHELQIAGAFMISLNGDDTKSFFDIKELDRLRTFWDRFHTDEPSLETEFLEFTEKATDKQKAILRRAM